MARIKGLFRRFRRFIEPQSFEQWLNFTTALAVGIPLLLDLSEGRTLALWILVILLISKKLKPIFSRMDKKDYVWEKK